MAGDYSIYVCQFRHGMRLFHNDITRRWCLRKHNLVPVWVRFHSFGKYLPYETAGQAPVAAPCKAVDCVIDSFKKHIAVFLSETGVLSGFAEFSED